jgi:quercetin dioxygenase-like cupin family protein
VKECCTLQIEPVSSYQRASESKFSREVICQAGGNVVFVLHFLPGQELPAHRHPDAHVVLVVLEGKGTVYADGAPREVAAGDIIQTGGEEQFALKNTGDAPLTAHVTLIRHQQG